MLSAADCYSQVENPGYPEKLSLLFNNNVKIVVESREILKIPDDKRQDTIVCVLLKDISKLQDSLSKFNVPVTITYDLIDREYRKIKIIPNTDVRAEFIIKNNSDTVTSSFFNFEISYKINNNNRLLLYTNNLAYLNNLTGLSFSKLIEQVRWDLSAKKLGYYKAKTCEYRVINNQLDVLHADIQRKGLFIISPGWDFGLSYLNDHFLSDISLSLGYIISPKTAKTYIVGISWEIYFNMDPSVPFNVLGNTFADAYFQWKDPYHRFYYARNTKFFIGYLTSREGEIFPNKTWRFGFDMPAGGNFRIEYAVYQSNMNHGNAGLFEIGIKYKGF
jgi:hypothetical protein